MKLNKAIEILEISLPYIPRPTLPDEHDAIKMGLEALKAIQILRGTNMTSNLWSLLPGEDGNEPTLPHYCPNNMPVGDPRD